MEMRYYDKTTHTEVFYEGEHTIPYGSGVIDWWFELLPEGYMVTYDSDGMPHKEKIPDPILPSPAETRRGEIKDEMDALIGDLTTPEAMFLMLRYGMLKMNTDANDEPTSTPALTPTGEDLIVWGDKLASKLEEKIIELRSL